MYGAPSLCGSSALISGCGLARVAIPAVCQEVVASYDRQYTTIGLQCNSDGKLTFSALQKIQEESQVATAVAIGPGLGQSEELDELILTLYETIEKPLVLDADALNAFSRRSRKVQSSYPRILTPHPGEFSRLMPNAKNQSRQRQCELAQELARQLNSILVLKGYNTIVTDGTNVYINSTGNPGMATGGAGDVLTGVIASLLAQQYDPFEAAQLGVYVHGLAGDLAAKSLGQTSVTAERILEFLPAAFKKLEMDSK